MALYSPKARGKRTPGTPVKDAAGLDQNGCADLRGSSRNSLYENANRARPLRGRKRPKNCICSTKRKGRDYRFRQRGVKGPGLKGQSPITRGKVKKGGEKKGKSRASSTATTYGILYLNLVPLCTNQGTYWWDGSQEE